MRKILIFIVLILLSVPAMAQTGWPPVLTKSEPFNNRPTDWYRHGIRAEWKCINPKQTDVFTVMHPKTGQAEGLPLYVVLHSAGHDVFSCMECTKKPGNHDIYHAPDGFYALYVDCRANKIDWWWGGRRNKEPITKENQNKATTALEPVEMRVLDTVKWVIDRYKIDSNRVYLCGNSMGGSGTLGLGLPHGDVFAAIKANVPAGARHAGDRLGLTSDDIKKNGSKAATSGIAPDLPDPPICIDYSAQNDQWSGDHEILFRGMKNRKYNLIAYWGNFGHANNNKVMEAVNDLINTFDWTAIRKNEAYPVFTNASSDDQIPWPDHIKSEKPGQVNAFFRWKNITDSDQSFEMVIFIDKNIKTKIFTIPNQATTDLSFRRLQKFNVKPGETIRWTFAGKSGSIKADAQGLITIPQVKITNEKMTIRLEK